MNKFVLGIILNTLRNMPSLVTDIEKVVADAEASGEDAGSKLKTTLTDLVAFLDTIIKVV